MCSGEEDPDAELAKDGWRNTARYLKLAVLSLGVAVLFSARSCLGCDPTPPDGLEFQYHGNHCGPGHGTDGEAITELDEACKRHDAAVDRQRGTLAP